MNYPYGQMPGGHHGYPPFQPSGGYPNQPAGRGRPPRISTNQSWGPSLGQMTPHSAYSTHSQHQMSPMAQSPYGQDRGWGPSPIQSGHGTPMHGYPPGQIPGQMPGQVPQYSPHSQASPLGYQDANYATGLPGAQGGSMGSQQGRRGSGGTPYNPLGQVPRRGGHFANLTWTPNKDKDKEGDNKGERAEAKSENQVKKEPQEPKSTFSQKPEPTRRTSDNAPAQRSREIHPLPPRVPQAAIPRGPKAPPNKVGFSLKPKSSVPNIKQEPSVWNNQIPPKPVQSSNGVLQPAQNGSVRRSSGRSSITWQANVRGDRKSELKAEQPVARKLRPKRVMQPEFMQSESVWFRKPGNESVVGSGTYGKVFKAVHIYTKQVVALKKIRMEGERDGFPVTAVREVKLLQSLHHDNIVQLIEVMVEKNLCYMVFEYVSHDLTGLLNHPSFKLELCHKKHLSKQLFEGLDYLHNRAGVLHRDIKAANILISREGQLKLADFGLARFYTRDRQLDYTNRVITIWYRSPELLLGETQYGPAVDMWSAACVMVEIFTRHAIFPGDGGEINQLDKIYQVLGTPNRAIWPKISDLAWYDLLKPREVKRSTFDDRYGERLTPHLLSLLKSMFLFDPEKRPSAQEVLEHLYFTEEEPAAEPANNLAELEGDWHEFESKAARKENDRKEKERERERRKAAAAAVEQAKVGAREEAEVKVENGVEDEEEPAAKRVKAE